MWKLYRLVSKRAYMYLEKGMVRDKLLKSLCLDIFLDSFYLSKKLTDFQFCQVSLSQKGLISLYNLLISFAMFMLFSSYIRIYAN